MLGVWYNISTCRWGDIVKIGWVLLYEPLDEVNLLQGDLHRVLVLRPAGGVRNP